MSKLNLKVNRVEDRKPKAPIVGLHGFYISLMAGHQLDYMNYSELYRGDLEGLVKRCTELEAALSTLKECITLRIEDLPYTQEWYYRGGTFYNESFQRIHSINPQKQSHVR